MGILNWLFGRPPAAPSVTAPPVLPTWQISENGNPTMPTSRGWLTVFESDGGWKFVLARAGDDDAHFSDAYETMAVAKEEAEAFLDGRPPRHQPLRQHYAERRRVRFAATIDEAEQLLPDIKAMLANPAANVTALRKVEKKAASRLKLFDWRISELERLGADRQTIARAKQLERDYAELTKAIATRIEERKKR